MAKASTSSAQCRGDVSHRQREEALPCSTPCVAHTLFSAPLGGSSGQQIHRQPKPSSCLLGLSNSTLRLGGQSVSSQSVVQKEVSLWETGGNLERVSSPRLCGVHEDSTSEEQEQRRGWRRGHDWKGLSKMSGVVAEL